MPSLANFAAIPPDPSVNQKSNDLDWLLFSSANPNPIDLLAPHPDAFEQELDNLGIDDSLLSSLVLPDDSLGNVNAFLAHRSPHCGPGSAITASSDSLSYYNELSNLESLYNESLSAYGGAVSEHSLFAHSDLDISLDALSAFHMPSPQRPSRSPSGELSDNSSAYGHSSGNSLFDVPTGYENISANGYYIQPSTASSNYVRRSHSGLVHRDVPSQSLNARAQAHPYVPADAAYDHNSGNESPEQGDPRRKYQCLQCPRAFARQFNLKTHMATHDPNRTKPHVCHHAGCGRSFSRKHDLGRHLVSIHQDSEHDSTSPKRPTVGSAVDREWCDRCGRGWIKSERSRDACQCSDDS